MIKYENLKSQNVENAEEVVRAFSQLLYGNTSGSMQINALIKQAIEEGQIEREDKKYVFYTYLTIDGFEKKYYKACGNDLTTNKTKAWVYTKTDLEFYKDYKKQYKVEKIEKEEF